MGAGVWTQKANVGGSGREGAVGFSIGTKGYIGTGGTGYEYGVPLKDFWEYDPSTNTWTQKADFAGAARVYAVGFSIGNKGYIGTGSSNYRYNCLNDFWEYDPSTNTWTQKANFGGVSREYAVGFSIGNKGYIGTGLAGGGAYYAPCKDFWEYDPSTNTWTQKADFAGVARWGAVGFSIGTKGYIGTGYGGSLLKDFWEYDPSTNTWTQKADFAGEARHNAVGFSIGDKGYIGTGHAGGGLLLKDFWEFSFSPIVQTTKATNVTDTVGTLNGNIQDLGKYSSVSCYFKYRKSSDSQWTNTPAQNMTSPGTFSQNLTGLQKDTIYYFKAVAEYEDGAEEGVLLTFTTIGVRIGVWNSGTAWVQKAGFAGIARLYATGFSVGDKGYIGLGWNNGHLNDFFEYNPSTNFWSQKANFPGGGRIYATGFSVGDRGYISCGQLSNGSYSKDLWEYDPSTNTWTQKADFAGAAREGAVGFSIGNKGYIGTGFNGAYLKDFWEYDPSTNTWTQKADFAGVARGYAVGFSIRDEGYISTGYDGSNYLKDLWEYDPSTNTWTQKADFAGVAREYAAGFSVGNKGYIGTGYDGSNYLKDLWEYDPSTNTWTQKTDFAGVARGYALGFSIGTKGYVGIGYSGSNSVTDFWQFDPLANTYVGATNITAHTARLNGTLSGLGKDSNGNNYTFNCYFRYRELGTQNWSYATPKVIKNSTDSYYIDVLSLSSNTTYEFQAIVECAAGVYYADNTLTFTTLKESATIQTDNATAIGFTSATLNGEVKSLGNYSELACYFNWRQKNTETWNTTSLRETLSGIGAFDYTLNELEEGKIYEFRAVGNYGNDYFYGDVKEFATSGITLPTVETDSATNIRKDSATLNGYLTSLGDYSSADCFFQYRVYGQSDWIETSPKETLSGIGVFSKSITGLTRNYIYEYRTVAETTGGRVYGTIESFETESWIFDHWEGDVTGSENPKTITMDKSKNITAVFIREP